MQEKPQRKSNAARTEHTRSALLQAARHLFATKGYADTSTPEIVKAAGVTRGALYHHFEDKPALFHAVLRAEFEAVAAQITQAALADERAETTSAIDALKAGSRGYLAAMQDVGRVRLMLRDGPAVLGHAILRQMDRETSSETLRLGLEQAMTQGGLRPLPLEPLTTQLSALFDRAALAVSEGDPPDAHLAVLDALFEALSIPASSASPSPPSDPS